MQGQSAKNQTRRLVSQDAALPEGLKPKGTHGVILNVALRLFAEQGYGGTSVRDIAGAAGVNPTTLYLHYSSKEHVLAELIRLGHEEHNRRLRSAQLECSPDPQHQLVALVRAHVLSHTDFSMLAVVASAEMHALSPNLAAPALEARRHSEELLLDILQRGIRLGVFKVRNVWLAMAAIGGMGLRVAHWYTADFGMSASEVADEYAMFACRIVGAPDDIAPRAATQKKDEESASREVATHVGTPPVA